MPWAVCLHLGSDDSFTGVLQFFSFLNVAENESPKSFSDSHQNCLRNDDLSDSRCLPTIWYDFLVIFHNLMTKTGVNQIQEK